MEKCKYCNRQATHERMGKNVCFDHGCIEKADVDKENTLNAIEYWEEIIKFALDNNDDDFDKSGVSVALLDFLEELKNL